MSEPVRRTRHPLLMPAVLAVCLLVGGAGSIQGGPLGIAFSLMALVPLVAVGRAISLARRKRKAEP